LFSRPLTVLTGLVAMLARTTQFEVNNVFIQYNRRN